MNWRAPGTRCGLRAWALSPSFSNNGNLRPAAPRWLLHILMEEALESLRPARFARVREFRGLHAELARLIEEAPPGEFPGGELGALARERGRAA